MTTESLSENNTASSADPNSTNIVNDDNNVAANTGETITAAIKTSPESPITNPKPCSSTTTKSLPDLSATSNPSTSSQVIKEEQDNKDRQIDQQDDQNESIYHLKWFPWNTGKIPIVMQSINGPCPLIATINVLLLREKIKLPPVLEQITANQLLAYIGECILDSKSDELSINDDADHQSNLEQNINDAMDILPKLKTGLDVNIRFTGITDFEYTPECIIFDLLRIPLYHGWLIDPSLTELNNAIGGRSYNQLVDSIISINESSSPLATIPTTSTSSSLSLTNVPMGISEALARKYVAEEFLERTASQLTSFGLHELREKIRDNEIGILFRNNHFLTLFKRDNELYTLVTDHGYLTEDYIIWESLDSIEGAGRFFDAQFQPSEATNRQMVEFQAIDERQKQLESDFQLALSLREEDDRSGGSMGGCQGLETAISDFELAKRLQAEEEERFKKLQQEQEQQQQQH